MMANEDWIVFACVLNEEDAKNFPSKHRNIRLVYFDVTKQEQIDKAFEEVRVAVGEQGLDALVNNAGLMFPSPAEFMPISDVQRQFDINVFGVYRVTQAALPLLRLGKSGRIVNTSSVASHFRTPFTSAYSASKAAVDAFSECLRQEVARWGIKVSTVRPGPVETKFGDTAMKFTGELREKYPAGSKCDEYYGKDIAHFPEVSRDFHQYSAKPVQVASTIRSLLLAARPRNFVYDTWGTWFSMTLMSWMPLWVVDRFMKSLFIVGK